MIPIRRSRSRSLPTQKTKFLSWMTAKTTRSMSSLAKERPPKVMTRSNRARGEKLSVQFKVVQPSRIASIVTKGWFTSCKLRERHLLLERLQLLTDAYFSRGKKIFRRFPREDEEHGHMTRASVKPRLLFPPISQVKADNSNHNIVDEEAITDIENPQDSEMTDVVEETEDGGVALVTPVKPSFTPASPPPTGHATRSATKKASEGSEGRNGSSPLRAPEPVKAIGSEGKGKKRSPFDGWKRTKTGVSGVGKGKKREGGVLIKEGSGKKAKSMAT